MTSRKASIAASAQDPYELDRLAEELATREEQHPPIPSDTRRSSSLDLPQLQLQSLSHDNPYLTSPDFNVEQFLLSRSYTSLPDLRTELREYLASLKEELVKLINDDYEAFISLSTDLRGEGSRLERMKSPLEELRAHVMNSREQLQAIEDSVKDKLERRAALRDEKTLLQLLLKISDSIGRVEALLLISSPDASGPPTSETLALRRSEEDVGQTDERNKSNRAKHLLRIATEYVQLLYHSEKASSASCTFVEEMQWRIERIKSTLSSDLEQYFASTISSFAALNEAQSERAKQTEANRARVMSDLIDCLRVYDMLGLWRDAEDVIRRELVRDFVKKTIYAESLASPQSPVLPHTPFPQSSFGASHKSSAMPPMTPYTPFTAFPTNQDSFFSSTATTDMDASIYLLDDSDSPLAGLYNKVLRFIARDLRTIMEAAEQVGLKRLHGGSNLAIRTSQPSEDILNMDLDSAIDQGFDILANVVWADICRAIMDDLGAVVFSAGKPEVFRKNYETTQAFIRSLEYLAPSVQAVKKMRSHPSYVSFERRWQLPVYFQLRWKDIVSRIEEALQSKSLPVNSADGGKLAQGALFALRQSNAIWDGICQCWSADIYLPNLGHRFWRLTLQILKRYRSWLEANVPRTLDPAAGMRTPNLERMGTPLGTPRPATPVLNQDSQSTEKSADENKTLFQCAVIIQDIREMERKILNLWTEQISGLLLHTPSEDETDQPEGILKASLAALTSFLPQLSSQIEAILARRCCDTLAPVKSLPGQFRATSQKHMPSNPSSFVPLILRPVKVFFGIGTGEGQAKALKEEFCVKISTGVIDAVSNRYMQHITAIRKNEESLRRLRTGRRTGFSFFASSSSSADDDSRDEEKVRTQLILDVEALGRDAESLSVDINNTPAFKALNYMVHANPTEVGTP